MMHFYDRSIYQLAQECLEAVREVAVSCPVISERKGGVLRIDFCPEPGENGRCFRSWLCLPEGPMDCDSVQVVYRIFPDWDYRIECEGAVVDCPAYAEMKIASAAIRAPKGAGGTSGPCKDIAKIPDGDAAEEYGFAEHEGARKFLVKNPIATLGDIFVAISGGTQEEDARMLEAASAVIANYFQKDSIAELIF